MPKFHNPPYFLDFALPGPSCTRTDASGPETGLFSLRTGKPHSGYSPQKMVGVDPACLQLISSMQSCHCVTLEGNIVLTAVGVSTVLSAEPTKIGHLTPISTKTLPAGLTSSTSPLSSFLRSFHSLQIR